MNSSGETMMSNVRFITDKNISSKEALEKAGWQPSEIIEVDAHASTEDLKGIHSKVNHIAAIKGEGFAVIAPTASDANNAIIDKSFGKNGALPKGRIAGKTSIITGAAQGFGQGIAEWFFAEGANVVIADLNKEKGRQLADSLNNQNKPNRALFIECNVAEFASVESMVEDTVKFFGGLDVLVSNAGILRAGGLDEMDADTFDLMTKVNYNAFFHCSKAGSAVMKLQTELKEDYFADILQVNSKSGLKGSNKNFAYAGAKFGGIGLTQSFALELMPNRVKVNAVCPGNFFEGPLWSDPEKGLFVQYLNAGKVPGAKTIEDVKKHYESQVPAGRGCRVKDVARALLYAIEQEYETGQAIPVTGGQNMLS